MLCPYNGGAGLNGVSAIHHFLVSEATAFNAYGHTADSLIRQASYIFPCRTLHQVSTVITSIHTALSNRGRQRQRRQRLACHPRARHRARHAKNKRWSPSRRPSGPQSLLPHPKQNQSQHPGLTANTTLSERGCSVRGRRGCPRRPPYWTSPPGHP